MKPLIINNIRYYGNRVMLILFALLLLGVAHFFNNSSIPLGEEYQLTNPFYPYIENLVWWQHVVLYFAIISVANATVFLILSFYFIAKKDRMNKTKRKYEFEFTEKIVSYIYSDFLKDIYSTNEFYASLRKSVKSKLAKETLFTVMLRTQEMISENLSIKFTTLVEKLGLHKRLEYLLYSRNLNEKIIALKIISYLRIKKYEKVITRYLKSNNYILRNEAMTALIMLSEKNHLNVILNQNHHFSRYDINVILDVVEKNLKEDIDYHSLINSPSPRIAAIGMMLIKIRNKTEYKDLVRSVLENKDVLLHEITWEVFASFASTEEDFDFMMVSFINENQDNRLTIMKALKRFENNEKMLSFLDNVIKNETILLKLEALKMLLETNMESLYSYKESDNENIAIAYNETVDLNLI